MDVPLLKKSFLLKVQSDILMSMDNQEITLLVRPDGIMRGCGAA